MRWKRNPDGSVELHFVADPAKTTFGISGGGQRGPVSIPWWREGSIHNEPAEPPPVDEPWEDSPRRQILRMLQRHTSHPVVW